MSPYLTIAEAADLARVSEKRVRNLMADGTLREGIHYTRPTHLGPRFKREALLSWLDPNRPDADDIPLRSNHRKNLVRGVAPLARVSVERS